MRQVAVLLSAILCALTSSAIYRVSLLSHEELNVNPEEIIRLPGLGLGLVCGADSVMLIDNPELATVGWTEPNPARSIVGCGKSFYAAAGDSIYRMASDSVPHKFVGRLDNEQFLLSSATDTTFFAITADEDFSCVYEINPKEGYCEPVICIEAALLKVFPLGDALLLWVDDTIMVAMDDGTVTPFYSDPSITDVELAPVGVLVATDKSVLWFTGTSEAVELLPAGATNLWWGDGDLLYYRTMEGDIMAIVGLEDFYVTSTTEQTTSEDSETGN